MNSFDFMDTLRGFLFGLLIGGSWMYCFMKLKEMFDFTKDTRETKK